VISQQVNQVTSQGVFSDQNLPPTDLHRPIVIRRCRPGMRRKRTMPIAFWNLMMLKRK